MTLLPRPARRSWRRRTSDVFTAEMLERRGADSWRSSTPWRRTTFVVFFEPPSLDERIVNQFALFSLDVAARRRASTPGSLEHPRPCRRIIIPAGLKWEVRDKLDQANITERVLFPGLDGLSRWLTRYYSPRVVAGSPRNGHDERC